MSDRTVVSNEIDILIRQLEQTASLLSKHTRDMGGLESSIKSCADSLLEARKDISKLFDSRNDIKQNCLKECGDFKHKIENVCTDVRRNSTKIAGLDQKVFNLRQDFNAHEDRIQSLEGYVAHEHEDRARRDREERNRDKDKKSKAFIIAWDVVKLAFQTLVAIGAAYLTVKWAG